MSSIDNGVFGISHVDVPVESIERSAKLYTEGLGFPRRDAGEGWLDLDASSVLLRLVEARGASRRAQLRIQVADVERVYRALVAVGGEKHYEPERTPRNEIVGSVRDIDANVITIWRPLTEDEYDHVPELPLETEWSLAAQVLLKSLLLAVPALFRPLARRRIVRLAEEIFPRTVITERDAIRAYILASAKVTRYRLREPLTRHGIDPDVFKVEFEAE